jgi:plasmid maintenance system antidote protein VapI
MDLQTVIRAELERRRQRNARYSLRGLATSLRVHHSTLSRILDGRRTVTPDAIQRLGARLGLDHDEIRELHLAENRKTVLRAVGDPRFRADSRWLAMMTGIPVDDLNLALHSLLHEGKLTMSSATQWTATTDG